MKTLTRIQAWKQIRRAFLRYSRTGSQCYLSHFGLCLAVRYSGASFVTQQVMKRDIDSVQPDDGSGYFWPLSRDGAKHRVKAITKILASRTRAKR